jgi:hypothetical protein
MTHKRLFLADLTDQHLTYLQRAAMIGGKEAREWVGEIAEGSLALYEVPGGIIGLKHEPKQIFVELLAGEGMTPYGREIVAAVRDLAGDQGVEAFVVDPRAVRLFRRFGFQPTGTYMRLQ